MDAVSTRDSIEILQNRIIAHMHQYTLRKTMHYTLVVILIIMIIINNNSNSNNTVWNFYNLILAFFHFSCLVFSYTKLNGVLNCVFFDFFFLSL